MSCIGVIDVKAVQVHPSCHGRRSPIGERPFALCVEAEGWSDPRFGQPGILDNACSGGRMLGLAAVAALVTASAPPPFPVETEGPRIVRICVVGRPRLVPTPAVITGRVYIHRSLVCFLPKDTLLRLDTARLRRAGLPVIPGPQHRARDIALVYCTLKGTTTVGQLDPAMAQIGTRDRKALGEACPRLPQGRSRTDTEKMLDSPFRGSEGTSQVCYANAGFSPVAHGGWKPERKREEIKAKIVSDIMITVLTMVTSSAEGVGPPGVALGMLVAEEYIVNVVKGFGDLSDLNDYEYAHSDVPAQQIEDVRRHGETIRTEMGDPFTGAAEDVGEITISLGDAEQELKAAEKSFDKAKSASTPAERSAALAEAQAHLTAATEKTEEAEKVLKKRKGNQTPKHENPATGEPSIDCKLGATIDRCESQNWRVPGCEALLEAFRHCREHGIYDANAMESSSSPPINPAGPRCADEDPLPHVSDKVIEQKLREACGALVARPEPGRNPCEQMRVSGLPASPGCDPTIAYDGCPTRVVVVRSRTTCVGPPPLGGGGPLDMTVCWVTGPGVGPHPPVLAGGRPFVFAIKGAALGQAREAIGLLEHKRPQGPAVYRLVDVTSGPRREP